MRPRPAIEVALDLRAAPSLVRKARRQPLPPEIKTVLHVAAGSKEVTEELATKYRKSEGQIQEACLFFLHQVVLYYGADSYRTLGLNPNATPEEVKEHKRWLLMWLHPDRNSNEWESAFFQRVVAAVKNVTDGKRIEGGPVISRPTQRRERLSTARQQRRGLIRGNHTHNRDFRFIWLFVSLSLIGTLLLMQHFFFA